MKHNFIVLGIIVCCVFNSTAQEDNSMLSLNVDGYLSGMPSIYLTKDSSLWQVLLHNRINYNVYPSENLTFSSLGFTIYEFNNHSFIADYLHKNLQLNCNVYEFNKYPKKIRCLLL